MCGRYTLTVGFLTDEMAEMIELCNRRASVSGRIDIGPDGDVHPGDCSPTLMVEQGSVRAVSMRWGFSNKDGKMIINARSEDVQNRPMFRHLTAENRCAIPVYGYYEWRERDRLKHLIMGREAFYLLGLYRSEEDALLRFVIMTREALGDHALIHNRMPLAVYSRTDVRRWLSGELSISDMDESRLPQLTIRPVGPEQLSIPFPDQSDSE